MAQDKTGTGHPDCVTINVREYCGTYIATAAGVKVRASCTACAEWAAKACAEKIYGMKGFTLKKVTGQTWIAENFVAPY